MILYQPNDKFGIRLIKEVALTKKSRINSTEFRMIAVSTLANIVVKRRNKQQQGVSQSLRNSRGHRKSVSVVSSKEPPAIGDDLHCVRINRVGVEHIELRLPNNLLELGQITPQDTVPKHSPQLLGHGEG